jgi:hypothetical protein
MIESLNVKEIILKKTTADDKSKNFLIRNI